MRSAHRLEGNGNHLAGDFAGDVRGNRNRLGGSVRGSVCGHGNHIDGDVYGNLVGNRNRVGGRVHGLMFGEDNEESYHTVPPPVWPQGPSAAHFADVERHLLSSRAPLYPPAAACPETPLKVLRIQVVNSRVVASQFVLDRAVRVRALDPNAPTYVFP